MAYFLYRYMSFESFVGMIQNKALTFVLPELWEDPKESAPLFHFLNHTDDSYQRVLLYAIHNKTYGQCWSRLDESDATWRIYSYNNHAIQIKVSTDKISLLQGVKIVPVKYSDSFVIDENKGEEAFLQSLATKRTAFQHEEEVRLIKHYKFFDTDDAEKHFKSLLVISDHPKKIEILNSLFPDKPIEEQVRELVLFFNEGNLKEKTIDVSFESIPDFIDGVKVHPLAQEWYAYIVSDFCARNNEPFNGKSALYSEE